MQVDFKFSNGEVVVDRSTGMRGVISTCTVRAGVNGYWVEFKKTDDSLGEAWFTEDRLAKAPAA